MATSSPNRRRQRSVRITISVLLLIVATAVVFPAVWTQSIMLLSVAAVVALVCGVVAARIMHSELAAARRAAALDRAEQARDYRTLSSARVQEHAAFTTAMTARVADRDRTINELGGTLRLAEKRTVIAEKRVRREVRRANVAEERASELEDELEIRAAKAEELRTWEGAELETVIDLLGWNEDDLVEELGTRLKEA